MAAKELLLLVVVVVASVLLVSDGVDSHPPTSTGDDEPSTWLAARRQRDVGQPGIASGLVPDTAQYRWTARRRGGVGNGHSSLTAEQWQRRERSKQRRLFIIQQQIMASLRLSRRPDVPDGAHRNMSDADVERLLTLLRRGDNDSDTSTRLAIVNRVHALLPTCLIDAPRAEQLTDAHLNVDKNNSTSTTPRVTERSRSRSSSRPMRLYFNTAELMDGNRRSLVQVRSAVLRLHRTGRLPLRRRSRDRRSDVTGEQETAHVRRRRPPGNGPPSTTRNSTSTSPFRLIVYQLTRRSAAFSNRRGGRRLVRSVPLPATSEPGWVRVDVRSAVEQWIRKPRRNFGLQVVVRDAKRRGRRRQYDALSILDGYDCCSGENSCHVTDGQNASNSASTYPTLDVILLQRVRRRRDGVVMAGYHHHHRRLRQRRPPRRRSRDRRDVTPTDQKSSTCRMETMVVSFAELGLGNVILEPEHFVTGYCHGSCSMPSHRESRLPPPHQPGALHKLNKETRSSGGACCVPSEQSSLTVLHVVQLQDNHTTRLTRTVLSDTVVSGCECRCIN